MNPYDEQIEQLINGEIKEVKVPLENFMAFREAWIKREDHKYIVGEASQGGDVIYRYDPTVL
ncbi:MAG TPA: hypothetical protein H9829_07035 [Candidatus Tetragenococcus pullicola]|nr:hypothetical protein [Candidatus Tetragenococcus pullicola]